MILDIDVHVTHIRDDSTGHDMLESARSACDVKIHTGCEKGPPLGLVGRVCRPRVGSTPSTGFTATSHNPGYGEKEDVSACGFRVVRMLPTEVSERLRLRSQNAGAGPGCAYTASMLTSLVIPDGKGK